MLASSPHRRGCLEASAVRLGRTPIPVPRPPLRPITRWIPRSVAPGPSAVWAWGGVVSSSGCARLSPCFSLSSFLILESTSSAPRMPTLMAKRVKAELDRLGIQTVFYLDVVLVLGSTFQSCLSVLQEALSLLTKGDSSSMGRSPALF